MSAIFRKRQKDITMTKSSQTKTAILISALTVGTLILTIILFNFKTPPCGDHLFSSSTLGQFGDFYGGILGTFITFFGLFFIYNTYQIQSDQLDIAKKDADLEIANKLYSELLAEINNLQYRRKVKDGNGKIIEQKEQLFLGIDALYNFDENHWHSPNSILNHLNSIMVSFDQLLFMIENKFRYKHKETKNILLVKTYFLFYSKITWPVYQEIWKHRRKELLEKKHPDAPPLFDLYKRLVKQTNAYLLKGGHIGELGDTNKEMGELLNG